jgi:hypothetical protein
MKEAKLTAISNTLKKWHYLPSQTIAIRGIVCQANTFKTWHCLPFQTHAISGIVYQFKPRVISIIVKQTTNYVKEVKLHTFQTFAINGIVYQTCAVSEIVYQSKQVYIK